MVQFCYADQLAALDPVAGNLELELPDLFIHQLEWTIEIPTRFESTAVGLCATGAGFCTK